MDQSGTNWWVRSVASRLWAVLLLLSLGMAGVTAQIELAVMEGTVVSEDGKPLEGVEFRIRDLERGRESVIVSDKNGRFYRRGLPAGPYAMTVQKEGYRPIQDKITLTAGVDRRLSFELAKAAPPGAEEFAQGVQAFNQNNFQAAIQAFEAALVKAPNLPEIHINLALAYMRVSRPSDAVAALERAVAAVPDTPRVLFQLGTAYLELNELDKSAAALEKGLAGVTKLDDEAYEATVALGAVYFAKGDVDKASAQFEKALSVRPDDATPKLGLGKVYASKEDFSRATQIFREVLAASAPGSREANEAQAFLKELERSGAPR